MRRTNIPELLDFDLGTPAEISRSLADLRSLNRYFGGYSTTLSLIERVLKSAPGSAHWSYLDVAGASGDGAQYTSQRLERLGVHLHVTVLDRSAAHLSSTEASIEMERICADALCLPFRDATFDLVGSSLFLHHLDPREVISCLDEALRVSRKAVLINDLERSPLHYAFAVCGKPIYRSRLTRHDAPASVRRAYSSEEMLELMKQTGATGIEMKRHFFYRLGAILWK
jgi:ubiquinone/menaquinone biosynthesis C-methylase UbiE